jgi:hypothetical protein
MGGLKEFGMNALRGFVFSCRPSEEHSNHSQTARQTNSFSSLICGPRKGYEPIQDKPNSEQACSGKRWSPQDTREAANDRV